MMSHRNLLAYRGLSPRERRIKRASINAACRQDEVDRIACERAIMSVPWGRGPRGEYLEAPVLCCSGCGSQPLTLHKLLTPTAPLRCSSCLEQTKSQLLTLGLPMPQVSSIPNHTVGKLVFRSSSPAKKTNKGKGKGKAPVGPEVLRLKAQLYKLRLERGWPAEKAAGRGRKGNDSSWLMSQLEELRSDPTITYQSK